MTHSRTGFGNRLVGWLSTVVFTVLWPVAAIAQAMPKADFDIPPQRLEAALQQVAQVQRVQILFSENDVRGLETPGVKGKLSTYEAVQKLIEGTGLSAVANQNNAIAIRPKSANDKGGQAANPTLLAQAPSAERRAASPSQDEAVRGEGIIVTARKRDELLTDVPMSISVVGAEEIDRRGLVSAEDYLRGIPGVSQTTGFSGSGAIVIRGIETTRADQNFGAGTTVAAYFGETPITNSGGLAGGSNIDLKLVDIERVEVLRGPQGTAYGNSSVGGDVRTIPVAPKLDRFEGRVVGGYSATSGTGGDNYLAQGVLNIPLIQDKLAIRGTAYKYEDAGYYRNVAGSDPAFQSHAARVGAQAFATDQDQVGTTRFEGGRFAALFKPTVDLRLSLNYLTQKTETDGVPMEHLPLYQQTIFQVAPQHVVRGQTAGVNDSDIDIASAVVEYDFDRASVLATYSHVSSNARYVFPRSANAGGTAAQPRTQLATSTHGADSGEIRVTTRFDGAWNALAGIYAEDLKDKADFNYYWYGSAESNPFGADPFWGNLRDVRRLQQTAAFGEVYWEAIPRVTVTAGVRGYNYERTGRLENTGVLFGTSTSTAAAEASGTTYRGNISYKVSDDALLYADWSQGFRLGRANPGLPRGVCDENGDGIVDGSDVSIEQTGIVHSDKADNFELGGKIELLNRRLTVSADVYRIDWSDMPVSVLAPLRPQGCGLVYLTNAGEARSDGFEVQARARLTKALRIDVGASWLNARLTKDVPAQGLRSGDPLPSPKVNASLGVQYEFSVAGTRAAARVDSTYVGPYYSNVGQHRQFPDSRSGGFVKVDLAVRAEINKFLVDLFVRNATNADDFVFRGVGPGNLTFGHRLRPRTVGFQIGYVF